MINRRLFIQGLAVAAAAGRPTASEANGTAAFGKLVKDPGGILDLPGGFDYRIIARSHEVMDDGLLGPGQADGMAAFPGSDGNVVLVCNHENHPVNAGNGPFGPHQERLAQVDPDLVYDLGKTKTPGIGGTTTIVYNTRTRETVSRHLSLTGTEYNCAGGPTPWGSWLSCEECFTGPGTSFEQGEVVHRDKRHGYVFEVPSSATGLVKPVPLRDMGRFEHEAAAVNPASGVVYMSEDQHRGLLYRYIPKVPGDLAAGGRLQALAIKGKRAFDTSNWRNTRNWRHAQGMKTRRWVDAHWIDLTDVDSDVDDLRLRGAEAGAAHFARGEGMTYADGSIFMTATIGGPERMGQVFEYRLGDADGSDEETETAGRFRLLAQSTSRSLLRNADNLTMSPWGDLIVCEDTADHCGLVGIRPDGEQYAIADHAYSTSELAGVCFSPDGSTLFVNIQDRGLTLAITGPWPGMT